jgi:hypothetical protein
VPTGFQDPEGDGEYLRQAGQREFNVTFFQAFRQSGYEEVLGLLRFARFRSNTEGTEETQRTQRLIFPCVLCASYVPSVLLPKGSEAIPH